MKIARYCLIPLLFLLVSCDKVNQRKDVPEVPDKDLISLKIQVISSLEDVRSFDYPGSINDRTIYMAVGETENVQVKIFPVDNQPLKMKWAKNHPEIQVTCSRLDSYGGYDDDVLVPCNDFVADESGAINLWLTIHASYKAKPNSKYTENIAFSSGTSRGIIRLSIKTGDVVIPRTPTVPSVFGIWTDMASDRKAYSDFLLDYRISPYFFDGWGADGHSINCNSAPYDYGDPLFWEYLKDERFCTICLPFYHMSDDQLAECISKAKSEGIWDKAIYYLYDEPSTMAQFAAIKQHADKLHSLDPDAKVMTTFYRGPQDGPYVNDIMATFDYLDLGRSDIFCVWNDDEGTAAETYRNKIHDNQQYWSYVTAYNHPGISLIDNSWEQRAMMWRYFDEGSTGFLYWAVNWYECEDPLQARIGTRYNDGQIVFPGKAYGSEGICPSVRLERWRDGVEDCEMLKIYESQHSREEALALLKNVYGGPMSVTRTEKAVEDFHRTLTGQE